MLAESTTKLRSSAAVRKKHDSLMGIFLKMAAGFSDFLGLQHA